MKINRKSTTIAASLLILLLIAVTVGLLLTRRDQPQPDATITANPRDLLPAGTATPTQNIGFLPLLSKPATPTLTPTQTPTLTPTITPTATPIVLSFCDQSGGPLPILDYAVITDTLDVDFPGVLLDVDLELDIQHSYSGDLEITLKMVDGPVITLVDRPGTAPLYCNQADIRAVFDDEATADASQACSLSPALSGLLRPEQPLSVFDQFPAASRWQLVVADRSAPDSGVLNRWCILATIR